MQIEMSVPDICRDKNKLEETMLLIEWFPSFLLFVVALAVGSQRDKPNFGLFTVMMLVCLLGIFYSWQHKHGFPGVLVSVFAAELSRWVVAIVIGLIIGRVVLSKSATNS